MATARKRTGLDSHHEDAAGIKLTKTTQPKPTRQRRVRFGRVRVWVCWLWVGNTNEGLSGSKNIFDQIRILLILFEPISALKLGRISTLLIQKL